MASSHVLTLAVAGAHLSGLPLNYQLVDLGAVLLRACKTAPVYKMYSLGPKPALIRQPQGSTDGNSIEVELWNIPIEKVGYFLRDGVKSPLGLGDVLLEDNTEVKGFIGEAFCVAGAEDITHHGGWRAYLGSKST